jgi:CheY-like chemotaxis protein
MSLTQKTILVVEDDGDSRLALCAILEGLGYNHISYSSGKEALEKISGQQIDLPYLIS